MKTVKIKQLAKEEKNKLLLSYVAMSDKDKETLGSPEEYVANSSNQTLLILQHVKATTSWKDIEEAIDFVKVIKQLKKEIKATEISIEDAEHALILKKMNEAIKTLKGSIMEVYVEVYEHFKSPLEAGREKK